MPITHGVNAPKAAHLTVRNLPARVAEAVRAESRRRGLSLNQTVIELLAAATGVGHDPAATNGLEQLAGTWSEDEFDQFEAALNDMSHIDDELWR